jgi:ferredoxin
MTPGNARLHYQALCASNQEYSIACPLDEKGTHEHMLNVGPSIDTAESEFGLHFYSKCSGSAVCACCNLVIRRKELSHHQFKKSTEFMADAILDKMKDSGFLSSAFEDVLCKTWDGTYPGDSKTIKDCFEKSVDAMFGDKDEQLPQGSFSFGDSPMIDFIRKSKMLMPELLGSSLQQVEMTAKHFEEHQKLPTAKDVYNARVQLKFVLNP